MSDDNVPTLEVAVATDDGESPSCRTVGFCSKCGIVRQDNNGVPVTDCVCTAKKRHADDCSYVKAVSCPVSVGVFCRHGKDACEQCDCNCGSEQFNESNQGA